MKPFVFIFRQGDRALSDEELSRRTEEARAWALSRLAKGQRLDPRIMTPEYCRVSAGEESRELPLSADTPPTAMLFLEAADAAEAVAMAKTHPGLRYGASIEVRAWISPLPPAGTATRT
jgi:hypothetical protein